MDRAVALTVLPVHARPGPLDAWMASEEPLRHFRCVALGSADRAAAACDREDTAPGVELDRSTESSCVEVPTPGAFAFRAA
jgi:hypothetical protein